MVMVELKKGLRYKCTQLKMKCQVRRRNIHRKFKTKSKIFAAFESLMEQDF